LNGQTLEDVVWFYPEPAEGAKAIAGLLCFYNEKVEITGSAVLPA
jgi:uncharacterized protein (DUF427 family)